MVLTKISSTPAHVLRIHCGYLLLVLNSCVLAATDHVAEEANGLRQLIAKLEAQKKALDNVNAAPSARVAISMAAGVAFATRNAPPFHQQVVALSRH